MTEVEPVSSMGVYERHNADTVSRVPSSWCAASYPAASAGTPRWEPFKAQKLNLTINRCGRVIVMRFYAVWGHRIAAGAIKMHQDAAKYDDFMLEISSITCSL